jgi:hypothetical protein
MPRLGIQQVLSVAFCSLGRRLGKSFVGQGPLAARGGAIPARNSPGERGASNHESHSALAPNIMSLWLRLQNGGVVCF